MEFGTPEADAFWAYSSVEALATWQLVGLGPSKCQEIA